MKRVILYLLAVFVALSLTGCGAQTAEATQPSVSAPTVRQENDRVYLCANGENLDITEEFSYTQPYIYSYTDGEGLMHYLIVGGDPDAVGVAKFHCNAEGRFTDGSARFGTSEGSEDAPWLGAAAEKLNLPWIH